MGAAENAIQRKILEYLQIRGVPCWRVNVVGVRGRRAANCGMGDIHAVGRGGQCIWIECKTATGVVSEVQRTFMAAVNKAGGRAVVCRSIADVIDQLYEEIP